MEIGVTGPIFTQKISKSLWDKNIHTTQDERNILWQLLIFVDLELSHAGTERAEHIQIIITSAQETGNLIPNQVR